MLCQEEVISSKVNIIRLKLLRLSRFIEFDFEGDLVGLTSPETNSVIVSPSVGIAVIVNYLSISHVRVWSFHACWVSVVSTCTAVLVSWGLLRKKVCVWVVPVAVSQKATRRVASGILVSLVRIEGCQADIVSSSINLL